VKVRLRFLLPLLAAVLALGAEAPRLGAEAPRLGAEAPRLATWRLEGARLEADPPAGYAPLAVGSLQKPFVARAWAQAHPGDPSPRFTCSAGSGCWFKAGHGELGLARALTLSCNTYFLALARDTPLPGLAATLAAEGFAPAPAQAEDAIGLAGTLSIRPSALLAAYRRLVLEPWPSGEALRGEVLAGLREAALTGTAAGLGHRGFWAKTGTVPDGGPLATCGLTVAVDDGGWAVLARLRPGTGREAAAALAAPLDRWRPWAARRGGPRRETPGDGAPPGVRVRLFSLLGPRRFEVRNLGQAPVAMGPGWLGPGARQELRPGQRVGPGLLELSAPGLTRCLQGEVVLSEGLVVATVAPRDYVAGVLAGELPQGGDLRVPLGAAVLRFLAAGPRHSGGHAGNHPGVDVCDSTHCAYFIGRGPRLDWTNPRRGEPLPGSGFELSDADWRSIQEAAQSPGPERWTAHCGGRPRSPRSVWGDGPDRAPPCPRHPEPTAPWTRSWTSAQAARAFGGTVARLEVGEEDGVWVLRATVAERVLRMKYDEAHRRIAAVLGWDALPSPAAQVEAGPDGFRLQGFGQGHQVGLCLAP